MEKKSILLIDDNEMVRESLGDILFVRDNGAGLQEEDANGLFELFRRGKSSSGVDGTGLGLAIVKEMADQHQGGVWIEPGPGQGVTFSVSIAKSLSPGQQNSSVAAVSLLA